MTVKLFVLFLIIIFSVFLSGCVTKNYVCPDTSKLQYFEQTQTYRDWISCKPPANCNPDYEYEKWVNENCGIKYKIEIAY